MKALRDFIIKLDKPLNETFKTENGTELFAHADFSVDRLSNRIAKVIATPLYFDSPIQKGYEVMIEPTILYKQIYKGIKQDYNHFIDKDNMLFKVTPNMIILYRKDENDGWKGHLKNLMVEQIPEDEPVIKTSLLLPKMSEQKFKKGRAKALYVNEEIKEWGVNEGDELVINPNGGVNFWLNGKHYWWIRNRDTYAIAV